MGRMEVITRVERRRRYSDEERAAVLAQCDEPGATVVGVSRRLGISASLIHGWRKTRREAERIASEPLQFITYGVVADFNQGLDLGDALTSLDGLTRSENDRQEFTPAYAPLPITHKDFFINLRALSASRERGEALDTSQARAAE